MQRVFVSFLVGCLFLLGCHEKNEATFLEKSFGIQKEIVQELSSVHSLQDLLVREETFTHLFSELSSVAIKADRWKKEHKGTRSCAPQENETTIALEQEFRRVLSIPGAEAFLERCQKKGLDRLDSYTHLN